jgi:hypothetical protein
VNVTEVDVYLLDTSLNLETFASAPYGTGYGHGWLPYLPSSYPLCSLTTPTVSETTFYQFQPITIFVPELSTNKPVEVRLFVEIYLKISNLTTVTNQQIVSEPSGKVSNVTLPYLYSAIYTG